MRHQKVFESTLVATRPFLKKVRDVLCYEIPTFTKSPFNPSIYEDVSKELSTKIKAFKMYKSELRKFPHHRSLEHVENLASMRGVEVGVKKAEAFQLIRSIRV